MSASVRPAKAGDIPAIVDIFTESFAESISHHTGNAPPPIDALTDILGSVIAVQPEWTLVLECQKSVAGYILFPPHMTKLWVKLIFTGHVFRWAMRWLRGGYGIGIRPIIQVMRDKVAFVSSTTKFAHGHIAQILSVAVKRSLRGRGFGEALLDKALQKLQRSNIERVKLEVRPTNTPALRLYQKYGFVPIGKSKDSLGEWLIMLKELNENTTRTA